ncbi:hypothetical protein C8R45DRAFT_937012 [Mycena sanguinolenta]|nr:hypothetical protein C8R45DRAFT_937012 [Mycena sanguinolenta]
MNPGAESRIKGLNEHITRGIPGAEDEQNWAYLEATPSLGSAEKLNMMHKRRARSSMKYVATPAIYPLYLRSLAARAALGALVVDYNMRHRYCPESSNFGVQNAGRDARARSKKGEETVDVYCPDKTIYPRHPESKRFNTGSQWGTVIVQEIRECVEEVLREAQAGERQEKRGQQRGLVICRSQGRNVYITVDPEEGLVGNCPLSAKRGRSRASMKLDANSAQLERIFEPMEGCRDGWIRRGRRDWVGSTPEFCGIIPKTKLGASEVVLRDARRRTRHGQVRTGRGERGYGRREQIGRRQGRRDGYDDEVENGDRSKRGVDDGVSTGLGSLGAWCRTRARVRKQATPPRALPLTLGYPSRLGNQRLLFAALEMLSRRLQGGGPRSVSLVRRLIVPVRSGKRNDAAPWQTEGEDDDGGCEAGKIRLGTAGNDGGGSGPGGRGVAHVYVHRDEFSV